MFTCIYKGQTCTGVNKYLSKGAHGKRFKNKEYAKFQNNLTYEMLKQGRYKPAMTETVSVKLFFSISKQRDIDSLIKPVLDCLQKASVIKNDNLIRRLLVIKDIKKTGEPDSIKIICSEIKLDTKDNIL